MQELFETEDNYVNFGRDWALSRAIQMRKFFQHHHTIPVTIAGVPPILHRVDFISTSKNPSFEIIWILFQLVKLISYCK